MRLKAQFMVFTLFLAIVAPGTAGAVDYWNIVDLGSGTTFDYYGNPQGFDINNAGQVSGANGNRTFLYSDSGVSLLPNNFYPYALNDKGVMAGAIDYGAPWPMGHSFQAALYDGSTITAFSGGSAKGINNSDHFIVNGRRPSCVYNHDGTDVYCMDSTYGAGFSKINDNDVVAGTRNNADGRAQAFIYDGENVRDIVIPSAVSSSITGINNSAQVVGQFQAVDGQKYSFLSDGSSITYFSQIHGANFMAGGINDQGQVAGSVLPDIFSRAVIFNGSNGLVDLNSLLDPSSGWFLSSAVDINNSEQVIGYGYLLNAPHMFLMSPSTIAPEPVSTVLVMLGGGAMILRRRVKWLAKS